jgi:MFS transporter, YQGE family, putative transporter
MKIKFQELRVFLSYLLNMRILLTTNFVYSLVLPILYSFIAMYIMRNTSDVSLVMSFQMANYTGLLITFFFNGFLLRIIPVHWLYSLGMLISSGSMVVI